MRVKKSPPRKEVRACPGKTCGAKAGESLPVPGGEVVSLWLGWWSGTDARHGACGEAFTKGVSPLGVRGGRAAGNFAACRRASLSGANGDRYRALRRELRARYHYSHHGTAPVRAVRATGDC